MPQVQEVARDIGVTTNAALDALRRMDEFVLSGASKISDDVAESLRRHFDTNPPTQECIRRPDEPWVLGPLARLLQQPPG